MNYIALDIGTTTIKGVLYDEWGNIVYETSRISKTFSEKVDYMEQDADEILKLVLDIIKQISRNSKEEISFISTSSYMHSIMAVDKNGNPLTKLYLWSDNRSKGYVEKYKKNGKGLEFYKKTGTPIHPMSPLYKLMWLKDNENTIFEKAFKFISIKGYLSYKLVGEYIVDYSIASASGMFNIFDLKWDDSVLKELGIESSKLEKTVRTTESFMLKNEKILEYTNLSRNTKYIIGASDGCLANLGSHGLTKGNAVVTIGTSGAVRVVNDRPMIDSKARTFSYILSDNLYVSGGALNNGGTVFEWLKSLFNEDIDLDNKLKGYSNFNNGLLFLPYLNGERAPYWNPKLKGAYLGINNSHNETDFVYSTIQGVCFAIKDVLNILKNQTDVHSIYANGGFTNSEFWIEKLSTILEIDINVLNQGDGACFGAYLLGLKAIGKISTLEESSKYFKKSKLYKFSKNNFDSMMFEIYKKSVKVNAEIFEKLSEIQTLI